MSDTLRAESRKEWTGNSWYESISAGSLQRIADAVEKMAQNHDQLRRRAESAEQSLDYWRQEAERLRLRIRSLKGQNTKLKKAATTRAAAALGDSE